MSKKKEFCKCVSEMEEKILELYKEKGELINPSEAKFVNSAILLSEGAGPGVQPFIPVEILSETKNGKPKKTKVNIYCTYCPMCGQYWREDKEKQNE
ncbi:hypothetical protein MMG00_09880 [Ignatzschineria rhizosphaerae]|uniref:Uncharacterized protein n=1 Tax=Ignatzschineria rhizosphaerae TaxID=2923279 RepID=A0ABY3WY37_9GAMM|nr:hypothetical protein [Ignatzschineria rhizosphaerae]UNM95529.1 hypothetical protein MMG00_09880 [Ignatzschineria rhizosphaerae]